MNNSLKLTITWLFLMASTLLSFFVADIDRNGLFVSILAYKKFLLVGFIYLDGIQSHWFYRMILILSGAGLLIGNLIWRMPKI
jgi:hypothetical protein